MPCAGVAPALRGVGSTAPPASAATPNTTSRRTAKPARRVTALLIGCLDTGGGYASSGTVPAREVLCQILPPCMLIDMATTESTGVAARGYSEDKEELLKRLRR